MRSPGAEAMPRSSPGFSLIEVILVVAIVGTLALTAIPKLFSVTQSAEDNTVKAIQGNIETSITIVHSMSLITGQAYDAQDIVNNIDAAGVQITVQDL